jgi:rhodanese-related sulfurtransferase
LEGDFFVKKLIASAIAAIMLILCGCAPASGYKQITQEEAQKIMQSESGYIILDVRTAEEFGSGHIPGAINIPNESIETEQPKELPDKNQMILVYCRSGRRSKQAAQKLADMGYTGVYEFGGINTWQGETTAQ